MRLLIDTHLVIWTLAGSPRLRAKARVLLRDPENECWVSAASVWEIAIKSAIGKLVMASPLRDLEKMLVADGFRILDVTMQHAATGAVRGGNHAPTQRRSIAGKDPSGHLRLTGLSSGTPALGRFLQRQPTIHRQRPAVNVARALTAQERNRYTNLPRLARTPRRRATHHRDARCLGH